MEDDLSQEDEEDESSSYEHLYAFERLGDPKLKKRRVSSFDQLEDRRLSRKMDLRLNINERREESPAISQARSQEKKKTASENEVDDLPEMVRELKKRVDAKNPYCSEILDEKGERLQTFISRWEKEARDVQGADDQALIAMLQVALAQGNVCKGEPHKSKKVAPETREAREKKRKDCAKVSYPTGYQASRPPIHVVQKLPHPLTFVKATTSKLRLNTVNIIVIASTHNIANCNTLKKEMNQPIARGLAPKGDRPALRAPT
ncbi:unnamed protein product [Cuscuta campestris]|uniref:Uncharacterized protein n=1 Tax=Cuscuta campestris TaxID=132261 RepID=A0A484L6J7_9ASTE|nr:unnamed protein product [Cuscuta campestris]